MSKIELIIDYIGDKRWYLNGKLHREDGPAFDCVNGYKEWSLNGKRHRLDGPAIEFIDGNKWWYYHGKNINCNSQQEFEKIIKLKEFW
ncbi:MAG TPA: hypothetical protein VHZ50_10060 [Puia sp.]|nr:hypothetical protein [Puia sp.]